MPPIPHFVDVQRVPPKPIILHETLEGVAKGSKKWWCSKFHIEDYTPMLEPTYIHRLS